MVWIIWVSKLFILWKDLPSGFCIVKFEFPNDQSINWSLHRSTSTLPCRYESCYFCRGFWEKFQIKRSNCVNTWNKSMTSPDLKVLKVFLRICLIVKKASVNLRGNILVSRTWLKISLGLHPGWRSLHMSLSALDLSESFNMYYNYYRSFVTLVSLLNVEIPNCWKKRKSGNTFVAKVVQ